MCCGQPVQPPTQKAAKFVLALKIIAFFQFIISILDLITIVFIREGILGIIMLLLLWSAFHKISYQSLVSYTFIALFFSITFLVYVMTEVQRGTNIEKVNNQDKYTFSIAVVTTAFYIFVSIFCFFPYREFKSIQYNISPGIRQFIGSNEAHNSEQERNDNLENNRELAGLQKQQGTFQAFQGQGIRIG